MTFSRAGKYRLAINQRFSLYLGALVWLVVLSSVSLANTYYLDPVNGDDSQSGTSEQLAWQSLSKVSAQSAAGDTIVIINFNDTLSATEWPDRIYRSAAIHQLEIQEQEAPSETLLARCKRKAMNRPWIVAVFLCGLVIVFFNQVLDGIRGIRSFFWPSSTAEVVLPAPAKRFPIYVIDPNSMLQNGRVVGKAVGKVERKGDVAALRQGSTDPRGLAETERLVILASKPPILYTLQHEADNESAIRRANHDRHRPTEGPEDTP